MKEKIILGVCSVVVVTVASSGVLAKNNGQGGGMRAEQSRGQVNRNAGGGSKYHTEAKSKNQQYQDEIDAEGRHEEHEARGKRKEGGYGENYSRDNASPGLKKQRQKKATQEQSELGRGSEKGRQSREEHSRKWWKFW